MSNATHPGHGNQAVSRRFSVVVNEANADEAEVYLYDLIGDYWGEGVSAKQFVKTVEEVAAKAKRLIVNINSPGGSAFDGDAIYNFLVRHPANVTMNIDGLAASAAATICMAGDQINIAENGLMMIHNSAGIVLGGAADMAKESEILTKLDATICATYAARSGKGKDEIKALMDAETWFSAEEAVAAGLASAVTPAKKAAALAGLSNRAVDALQVKHKNKLAALIANAAATNPQDAKGNVMTAEEQAKQKAENEVKEKAKAEAEAKVKAENEAKAKAEAEAKAKADAAANAAPGKRFLDAFGDQGGVWFAQGVSFEDAQMKFVESLKATNKAQADTIADLTKKLAAATGALGGPGVTADPSDKAGTPEEQADAAKMAALLTVYNGDKAAAKKAFDAWVAGGRRGVKKPAK